MEIEKLGGTTERLYRLVAPLVMKPCILRENNNYPFKTSMHHIWFIAIEEERVVGFMPVEIKDKYAVINNYYIDKDDPDLLAALLREVIMPDNINCNLLLTLAIYLCLQRMAFL